MNGVYLVFSAPYSFDKDVLMKLLEEEKEKIRHKLEGFAVFLREAAVSQRCCERGVVGIIGNLKQSHI